MNHFLSSCDPHSAALFSEPDTIQSFPRLQNEATKMQDILFVWPKWSFTIRAVPRQVILKTQMLNKYRLLGERLTWHWGPGRSRTLQHQCSKTVLSRNIPNACDAINRCKWKGFVIRKSKKSHLWCFFDKHRYPQNTCWGLTSHKRVVSSDDALVNRRILCLKAAQ